MTAETNIHSTGPSQLPDAKQPNFFIVGAPKCGTTSMHGYLQTHPQIYMTDIKEPHYFCTDFPGLRRFPTPTDYDNLFSAVEPQHVYRGEATSRYLYSETAIPNILKFDPNAKIVAMLRNPVDLVHSLHAQLVYQFFEDETDFETAWRLQTARATGRNIPSSCPETAELQYGSVASLGEQVARLFDVVPREQVLLIFFDDFKANAQRAYRDTLDFLKLPYDDRRQFEKSNPHKRYRSGVLAKLLFDPPTPLRQIKRGLKHAFGWQETRVGRWAYGRMTVPTKRNAMPVELRNELIEYFTEDVRRLESLTSRDLSAWRTPVKTMKTAA